jgi:hypothetical protein
MRRQQVKLFLIITIVTFFLIGCTQNNNHTPEKTVNNIFDQTIWYVDYETPNSTGTLKRSKCLDTLEKSSEKLIDEINLKFPKVGLELLKISKDTIYINVINSDVLTESMGTTGSNEFIAITTYTLTEIDSIKNVYFEMVDGSHAGKGVSTRNSFKTIFEIK